MNHRQQYSLRRQRPRRQWKQVLVGYSEKRREPCCQELIRRVFELCLSVEHAQIETHDLTVVPRDDRKDELAVSDDVRRGGPSGPA